ncbi:MAG TPA: hypothetical protein VHY84_27425 [Bryobacteraceae bacterium]|jgi:hypothetical protein|nr:hypothetical protein [Bryobacteraceae bacterium]
MKTLTLSLILAVCAFAQTKPAAPATVSAPAAKSASEKPHATTDKQRGDFFLEQFRFSQTELAIAKSRIDALEKLLLDPHVQARERAGQAIVHACPDAKLTDAGDIECPLPKPTDAKAADKTAAPEAKEPKSAPPK